MLTPTHNTKAVPRRAAAAVMARAHLSFLAVTVALQWLMLSKFSVLFDQPTHATWQRFTRNYHMSGFDPITYLVLTDWHQGYDMVRHPLLAWMMWPLSQLNTLLTAATGHGCTLYVEAALLTACGYGSCLMVWKTLRRVVGTGAPAAWLLTMMFLSFAYVMLAIVVADHFCLSMFMLTATLYAAGMKMRRRRRFTAAEAVALFTVTAGITLSNGIVVLMAVLLVNGRAAWRPAFFLKAVAAPPLVMLALGLAQATSGTGGAGAVAGAMRHQTQWVGTDAPRADVVMENMLGESVQLHRRHVLGDVLSGRPVVVRYSWKAQYAVVLVLALLLAAGVAAGLRQPFGRLVAAVLAFNLLLHAVLGFAVGEAHIMAAHWVFVIPLSAGWLFVRAGRPARAALTALTAVLTAYLMAYNGTLIYNYLTWPLIP